MLTIKANIVTTPTFKAEILTSAAIVGDSYVDVRKYGSLALAVTRIGAAKKTILIPTPQAVTDDLNIPDNIAPWFIQGGSLNISAGKTVTMPEPLAGLYQIFDGEGSVVITSGEVLPHWWGITGSADDTALIQAAIDACPVGGRVAGLGETYIVTKCNLKSYMRLEDFYFITKAGSVDDVSPVNVGEYYDTSERRDIIIRNVHVNGNRQNQSSILIPQEDGKRHGFRFIGHLRNILVDNCSGTYCASDGIKFGGGISTRGGEEDINTCLQFNIIIRDSRFNWNRRHGGSADTNDGLVFENCELNNNGQDLNGTDPLDHGNRGARFGGALYGCGFDMEASGVGSAFKNIRFSHCQGLQNVRGGILIMDTTDQRTEGYNVHDNIVVEDCQLDEGTIPIWYTALVIDTNSANETWGDIYSNVRVVNNHLKGRYLLRCARNAYIGGGMIDPPSPSVLGHIKYSNNVAIGPFANPTGASFTISSTTYGFDFGQIGFSFRTAIPGSGTWKLGWIIWNTSPSAGGAPGWVCVHSGTYGPATDNTGDTDGSTAVITGMTDTSDFNIGDYVDVSTGFPTTGPYRILAKTATTITLDTNSNSAQSNITVDTPTPTWKAMASVAT